MLHFFFFSVCKKSEHMTLKCLGYLFKHKKQLFHQKLKKNNKFFLKCHSHLQLFRIGNKGIFYHTWCESSKPLLSDQIVLMIERPQLWQKSRKTMNMHRTKNWQTVREQQKSARAPPFQKIKRNPLNQVTLMQKSCFLGPTIFEIPQPN